MSKDEQLARMRKALSSAKSKLKGAGAYAGFVPVRRLAGKGAYRGFAPVSRLRGRGAYGQRGLRGRGDFFNDAINWTGKTAGNIVKAAAPIGGALALGSKLFGMGDYRIAPDSVPLFQSEPGHRLNSFIHKEYLGDIFSSQDFAATTFNINPGLNDPGNAIAGNRGMFPWLARIAQQYEEYKIDGMVVYYVPTSSDSVVASATTPAMGSVSIATEYNANKPNFTNLVDMLNHQFSNSKKPSEMIAHPIECDLKDRPMPMQYIRSDTQADGDILHYDLGKTTVAVTGCQADGQNLGQLWVSYKVSLFKPILAEQADSPFVLSTHYRIGTGVTTSAYFGSSIPTTPENGSTFEVTLANTTITFPESITSGNWIFGYRVTGASSVITNALTVTLTSGASSLAMFHAGASAALAPFPAGATSTVLSSVFAFTITAPSAVLTLSSGTIPGTQTTGDLFITQFNPNLITEPIPTKALHGCFWRPSKDYPNPPWITRVTAEERNAVTQADLMAVLKTLIAERKQETKRELEYVEVDERDDEKVDKAAAPTPSEKSAKVGARVLVGSKKVS